MEALSPELDIGRITSSLRDTGYAVVHRALSRELIDDVGNYLSGEVRLAVEIMRAEFGLAADGDLVSAIDAAVADGGARLPKEIRDIATGHFPLAVRLSERLWPVASALKPLVAALLGIERVAVHLPPAARFVLPGNTRAGVPPHQDFRYNEHLPQFLTVWTPFVDIDEQCGGVIVYEGPRNRDLPVPPPDGPWLGGVRTMEHSPQHIEVMRGDVLVLDARIVHGSAPNSSDQVRISADYRFFNGAERSLKHALDLDSMTVLPPPENT